MSNPLSLSPPDCELSPIVTSLVTIESTGQSTPVINTRCHPHRQPDSADIFVCTDSSFAFTRRPLADKREITYRCVSRMKTEINLKNMKKINICGATAISSLVTPFEVGKKGIQKYKKTKDHNKNPKPPENKRTYLAMHVFPQPFTTDTLSKRSKTLTDHFGFPFRFRLHSSLSS